jgi:hypothetical protein
VARDLRDRLQVDAALGQPRDQRAPTAVRRRAGGAGSSSPSSTTVVAP